MYSRTVGYDLIGDIHGCSRTLKALLGRLGYSCVDGVYRHPSRRVIFLGDFIDRGSGQCEVVAIAKSMVDAGTALSVMGNHEFNAIAYHTRDPVTGGYLREHSTRNARQHRAFLDAYGNRPVDYRAVIDWFRTLPLWLDLGALRVIHACWDRTWIERIQGYQAGGRLLGEKLLLESCRESTWQFEAIETLLKGKEITLQDGAGFRDKDGTLRHNIRVRWWDRTASTYRQAFLGPEGGRTHIPDDEITGDHLVEYAHDEPPVFLGHYWLEGTPTVLADNIACLDYSAEKPGGKLVAYRWSGEKQLESKNLVWVDRAETGANG